MPEITLNDETIECKSYRQLLQVLPKDTVSASGPMDLCRIGTCGGCAVEVEGEVSEPTDIEASRLANKWDDGEESLRLACQTTVLGDVDVTLPDD